MTLDRADAAAPRRVVRVPKEGWLGGVCVGLSQHLGVPALVLRLAFVVLASWRLTGVLAYFLVWLIVPLVADEPDAPGIDAATRTGLRTPDVQPEPSPLQGEWGQLLALSLVGAGLTWAVQSTQWGLPGGLFVAGLLGAVGVGILWWQADHASPRDIRAADGPFAWLAPLLAHWTTVLALVIGLATAGSAVALVAAILPLGGVGRTLAAVGLAISALATLAAPWLLRVRRSLASAREAKLISDARADIAAHLHDSVLQTLALIQKQADDPHEVVRVARRQERELRAWLYGAEVQEATLASALADAVQEIEDNYPVNVQLVNVGDQALTAPLAELVRAAREAILNAAKHSGAAVVDVYAEAADGRVEVFVRDRGRGFDAGDVPSGRMGISKSIMDRMERHGGTARVRSSDHGTEVTLEMTP